MADSNGKPLHEIMAELLANNGSQDSDKNKNVVGKTNTKVQIEKTDENVVDEKIDTDTIVKSAPFVKDPNGTQDEQVDGLAKGILVVSDPEITSEDFEEVADELQGIVDKTDAGELPYTDKYKGDYILSCPICGGTFVSDKLLENGEDTCPICCKVPDSFVVNGKIEGEESVENKDDVQEEIEHEENLEEVPEEDLEEREPEDIENQEESSLRKEGKEMSENKLQEEKEVKTEYYSMPEDEHIIWDSQIDYYDENYMSDIKNNQYQDYLDSLGEDEEPEDFESWYEEYIDAMSYDDARWLEEDLDENILPNIDNQLNSDILLLTGSYSSNYPDFKSSGNGGKLFKGIDDFRNYMGKWDRICITTQEGVLGAILDDHDGTVSGQFYTIPTGKDKIEMLRKMGYEERLSEEYEEEEIDKYGAEGLMEDIFDNDMYYDGLDARDFSDVADMLIPVKDTISGYAPTDPDKTITESKENNSVEELLDLLDKVNITNKQRAFCEFTGISRAQLNGSQGFNERNAKVFIPKVKEWLAKNNQMTEPKKESKENLDINSSKKYKKVQLTFKCDDCGYKENYLYDNLSEKELAELEESDSNTLVGDCPKCNSKYYNMKDYKIIGESKKVKTESLSYGDLEESKKVKTEARGSRNEISTSFSVDRDNPLWIKGTCRYLNKEYIVNAKVFLEGSEYGINEGPVSKLWIQSQEDKEVIVNYDRGWDVEPKDSTMQQMMDLVIASVEHFRKEHPYEVEDDELEESKNKEKKEEYIERGFSGDPFDKHDFKDLTDLEEYIIDHGYELLNDGHIEPNATTVEVFDPAGNDGEVYVYDIEESANGVKIKMNSKDSFNMFNMNESKKVDREKLTESDKHIVWSTTPEEVTDINDSDFREWLNINVYDIDDEIYKSASAEHMGEDPTAEDLKYAEEEVLENYLEQYNELISEQVLEDWESNIEPLIEEQLCKEDLLILLGTAQTWNRTGDAGRVVRSMKELRELMSNYDIEMIVDVDNNLSIEMIHHDGTHKMGLYTFNEDYEGLFNKLKELDPEEFGDYEDYEDASDMYYDEDYVEYAVDNGYQAELREFLIPIKWNI